MTSSSPGAAASGDVPACCPYFRPPPVYRTTPSMNSAGSRLTPDSSTSTPAPTTSSAPATEFGSCKYRRTGTEHASQPLPIPRLRVHLPALLRARRRLLRHKTPDSDTMSRFVLRCALRPPHRHCRFSGCAGYRVGNISGRDLQGVRSVYVPDGEEHQPLSPICR